HTRSVTSLQTSIMCSTLLYLIPYLCSFPFFFFFFFNDTATTEIYTLSLHDALPICFGIIRKVIAHRQIRAYSRPPGDVLDAPDRSEEHTSELQSHLNLVCRLLLEKKKKSSKQSNMKQ